jgi:phosphonate transport system substrate-binding protein
VNLSPLQIATLIVGAVLTFALPAYADSRPGPTLLMAVQGSHSLPVLAHTIQPLVNHMERELGVSIRWETASRHKKLIGRITNKRYDLLFVDAPTTLHAYYKAGYYPVARIPGVISASFVGFVNGPALILEDMKGLRIGYLRPMMLATQLAKRHLLDRGYQPEKFFKEEIYLANHNSALNALRHGRVDVISIASAVYAAHDGEFDNRDLIIIEQTQAVPQYAFSVRATLDRKMKNSIKQALLNAHRSPIAAEFFKRRIVNRIIATDIATYKPFRDIQQYLKN